MNGGQKVYCGKCGANIEDNISFCPECGEPCTKPTETKIYTAGKQSKLSNKAKKILAMVLVIAVILIGAFSIESTVNTACDWCGSKPSVKYKTSDGAYSYVCKDCSKQCMFCNKKAKKHYENYFGMMVFVCNDCYKDMASD